MRASLRDSLRGEGRTLAGLLVAGLLLGGAAVGMLRTVGEWAEPAPAEAKVRLRNGATLKSAVTRQVGRAIANRAGANAVTTPPAAAAKPAKGAKPAPGSRAVNASTAQRLTVAPVSRPAVADPAADPGPQYRYSTIGRRDPFLPLVGGTFVDIDAPPELGGLKVVGVVWGADDRFALAEDARGNSYVLREGDKVMNGVVQGLRRDALIVSLTTDGQTQTVTIPLTRKGDSDANR